MVDARETTAVLEDTDPSITSSTSVTITHLPPPAVERSLSRSHSRQSISHALPTRSSQNWRQRKILMSLAIAQFTSYLSMAVMSPFFPSVGLRKQISETWVGLIFASYALFVFIGSPIWGGLMQKIGAKFLFLSGMFVAGISNIVFGLLDLSPPGTTFIVLCLSVRFMEAMGSAAFITSVFAIIVDEFPDNIGTVIGTLEIFVGLGMIVGPAMGGVLYGYGGFKLPFMLIGAFRVGICLPLNWYLIPAAPTGDDEEENLVEDSDNEDLFTDLVADNKLDEEHLYTKPTSFNLLKSSNALIVGFSVTATSSVWAFLDPTLEPHLEEFSLDSQTLGLIFLLASTSYALFAPLFGYIADKMSTHNTTHLVSGGMVICALSLFFIGPSPFLSSIIDNELWLNIVCMVILGMANALALIPTFEMIVEEATERGMPEDMATYGVVSGVWGSFYSLGEFIGPASAGQMTDSFGFPWASTIYSMVIVALAAVMFFNTVFRQALAKLRSRSNPCDSTLRTLATINGGVVREENGRITYLETTHLLPRRDCRTVTNSTTPSSSRTKYETTFLDPSS